MPRTRGNGSVVGQVITPGGSGVVAAQDATQYILSGQWPDSKYAPTSGASVTVSSIIVTDSGYNNLDDVAAATSNSYIKILGSGFSSTANVFLNGTMVPKANITFVSSSELRAILPVSNTGNYAISVFNSNTTGALYSNTFTISTMPQWLTSATLANVTSNTVFSNTLSATSDSSVTYSNTTILPTGMTLLSNGYFYGNISVGAQTTYSFDVKATDAENQDSTRTFSLTVSTAPITYSIDYVVVAGGGAGSEGIIRYPTYPSGYPGLGGGGGGGGGVTTGTFTTTRGNTITVTVGGGATNYNGYSASSPASNGNSSLLSTTGLSVNTTGGFGAGFQVHPTSPGTITNGGIRGGNAGNFNEGGGTGGLGGPLTTTGVNWVNNGGGGGGGGGAGPGSNGGTGGGINESYTAGGLTSAKGQFAGAGGNGLTVTIYGTPATYGGGGAGMATKTPAYNPGSPTTGAVCSVAPVSGGMGGGGNSSYGRAWNGPYPSPASTAPPAGGEPYYTSGTSGGVNTGGGGSGGGNVFLGYNYPQGSSTGGGFSSGSGGSGVVILSMPTANYPGSAPGATVTNPPAAPGKTILTYNSSGTFTA